MMSRQLSNSPAGIEAKAVQPLKVPVKSHICLSDGTRFRNRRSLDEMSKLLNPKRFYRANKQFIIAKKQIKSIIVWPDSRLLLEIGQPLPERIFISKNRSADFRRWITE